MPYLVYSGKSQSGSRLISGKCIQETALFQQTNKYSKSAIETKKKKKICIPTNKYLKSTVQTNEKGLYSSKEILKVYNRNKRKRSEICEKLTIKTIERRH